jgi:hypothetical protein
VARTTKQFGAEARFGYQILRVNIITETLFHSLAMENKSVSGQLDSCVRRSVRRTLLRAA